MMYFFGGTNTNTSIHDFTVWHSTTSQFLVSLNINRYIILNFLFLATSVYVERIFSQGRLILSHVRSRLSVQSTRALICLGVWSLMGYVHDNDVKAAALLPEVDGDEDQLAEDWDKI